MKESEGELIGSREVNCPACNRAYTYKKMAKIRYTGSHQIFSCFGCGEPLQIGYYLLDGSMCIKSRQLKLEF